MYLAVEIESPSLCVYWKSESRLNQLYNRDVNTLEFGTNSIYEPKISGHFVQFHEFLVWLFL